MVGARLISCFCTMAVRLLLAALCALCAIGVASASERDLLVFADPFTKLSFPLEGDNTAKDLPYDDPRVAAPTRVCTPQQVRLTYWSPSTVLVSWQCCEGEVVQGSPKPLNTSGMSPLVYWGDAGSKDAGRTARGKTASYAYDYSSLKMKNGSAAPSYQSGYINHVLLKGLQGGASYWYKASCDVEHKGQRYSLTSQQFTFKMVKSNYVGLTLGLFADPGQTYNTTEIMANLMQWNPDALIMVGDFTYADNYGADGSYPSTVNGTSTYQPRWDTWGRLFEPLLSRIPFIHSEGNHEIEKQPNNMTFVGHNIRYPNPGSPWGDLNFSGVPPAPRATPNNLYHVVELPGVKVITLSSHIPGDTFSTSSPQYIWFEKQLQAVDRAVAPWVIVMLHSPWYTSYIGHYKENECMRLTFEKLFKDYAVDLVINGHVHSYERSNQVYNWKVDDCGPVHLVVGNAGNIEGLYAQYIDDIPSRNGTTATGFCKNASSRTFPTYQPQRCFSYQPQDDPKNSSNPVGYCFSKQPEWSAFRDPSFGSGILKIVDSQTAQWCWKKRPGGPALDQVTIRRNLKCPGATNKRAADNKPTGLVLPTFG